VDEQVGVKKAKSVGEKGARLGTVLFVLLHVKLWGKLSFVAGYLKERAKEEGGRSGREGTRYRLGHAW